MQLRKRWFAVGIWAGLVLGAALPAPSAGATAEEPTSGVQRQGRAGMEGVASYYARRYEGRRTASGERYRADRLTAAHPDLPLGSKVKVIHPDTGRDVIVRVNDRCRGNKTAVIDLSRAAAKKLGLLGRGTAKVQIVPLPRDETSRAGAPPRASEAQPRYTVRTGRVWQAPPGPSGLD